MFREKFEEDGKNPGSDQKRLKRLLGRPLDFEELVRYDPKLHEIDWTTEIFSLSFGDSDKEKYTTEKQFVKWYFNNRLHPMERVRTNGYDITGFGESSPIIFFYRLKEKIT